MKRLAIILVLGALAVLLHTQIFYSGWGARLETLIVDFWFNLRGKQEAPSDIILVAMDEDSYQELSIPMDRAWPRQVHARLLKRLASAGAKRVAFDIAFLGASDNPGADKELEEALALLPTVIGADSGTAVGVHKIEQLLLPKKEFRKAAESVALVGFPEDAGVIRRFKTKRTGRTREYPTLSEAALKLKRDGAALPQPQDFINYYGPAGSIETYSYYEILDPEIVSDDMLRAKTVFVGLMLRTELGPAQKDSFLTPFWHRGRTFGVEIHATAAANLQSGEWIRRFKPWAEGAVLALITLLATACLFALKPASAGMLLLIIVLGWFILSYSAFLAGVFVPGGVLSLLVLPLAYLCSTLYYYFISSKAQRQTQRAFEFYLSPKMAREVAKNPDALKSGGETVYATAMFTDIIGFTPITEKMHAQEVGRMLNRYFTDVMGVIVEEQGTLIKFIGDAVFAIWGAPINIEDHAERAARSAVEIQRRIEEFNARKEFPPLDTRIGIHTGPMVVGNLGSDSRFDYTAIGDAVNLASRLEALNNKFGTKVLISDQTERELKSSFRKLRLGSVSVKGKSEAVGVFALLDQDVGIEAEENWKAALQSFGAQEWDQAILNFSSFSKSCPALKTAASFYIWYITKNLMGKKIAESDWRAELLLDSK